MTDNRWGDLGEQGVVIQVGACSLPELAQFGAIANYLRGGVALDATRSGGELVVCGGRVALQDALAALQRIRLILGIEDPAIVPDVVAVTSPGFLELMIVSSSRDVLRLALGQPGLRDAVIGQRATGGADLLEPLPDAGYPQFALGSNELMTISANGDRSSVACVLRPSSGTAAALPE